MELHAVEPARVIGDGGERCAVGNADGTEAVGQTDDAVAVAHPHLFALGPHAFEQRAVFCYVDIGAAEFPVIRAFDLAAGLRHHGLLAVADAQDRQAHIEQRRVRPRSAVVGHGTRPAGQDQAFRLKGLDIGLGGGLERVDFAIDAGFAHAPGDQLRHLRAEVDDQNAFGVKVRCGNGHGGLRIQTDAIDDSHAPHKARLTCVSGLAQHVSNDILLRTSLTEVSMVRAVNIPVVNSGASVGADPAARAPAVRRTSAGRLRAVGTGRG
jgi:hypothetical protein